MRYRVHDETSFREAIRSIAVKFEPGKRGTAWLTRETYSLLANLLDDDLLELSEICVSKPDERGAKPSYPNPFQPGIRVLSDSISQNLTRDFRSKMAMRMHFAYSHFVPKEFVLGFLQEYGKKAVGIKPDHFNVVPDLREWVAYKLLDGEEYGEYRLLSQPDVYNEIDRLRQIKADALLSRETGDGDEDSHDWDKDW